MAGKVTISEACGSTPCSGESGETGTSKEKLAAALRELADCQEQAGCDESAAEWREIADELDPQ